MIMLEAKNMPDLIFYGKRLVADTVRTIHKENAIEIIYKKPAHQTEIPENT